MSEELTGYELSRNWFDFCFENTDLITPTHTAVYFFCIEHCNRLGWKSKFGLPTQMAMEAIGVKNWRTYTKAFNDIVDWGFIKIIQKSKNQYSSNIIAIVKNTKALPKAITEANATTDTEANTEAATVKNTKALSKAIQKHSQKQRNGIAHIDKPYNYRTIEQVGEKSTRFIPPTLEDIKNYCLERKNYVDADKFFDFYESKGWMVGKNKMKDWRASVRTWEKEKKGSQSRVGQSLPPVDENEKNKLLAKIGG
jgi:hypothetical protein